MRKIGERIIDKRIRFKGDFIENFLLDIKKTNNFTWKEFADRLNLSEHTLAFDWKNSSTMPYNIFLKLIKEYSSISLDNIEKFWIKEILPEYWGQKKSGEKILKKIKIPKKSEELAEILGVILGDGHTERKTLTITGNIYENIHHKYIIKQIKKIFDIDSKNYFVQKDHTSIIKVYSKELVNFFVQNGMRLGNKIKFKARFPEWIFQNKNFIYGSLRGLLDTDGGLYNKQKNYKRVFIEFQTNSPYIREDIIRMLKSINFTPSISSGNVRIHRNKEIIKFFQIIGSSNPKNIIRYHHFIKTGEIPKKEEIINDIDNFKDKIPFRSSFS